MKYGLSKAAIEKICSVFACFGAIEKAVLYGSRATGNFKTGSDIDLTLYGDALTSDLCSAIASALDDQLLPYTIDLSVFEDLNHVKLREHIERVGVIFYERNSAADHPGAALNNGWKATTLGTEIDLLAGFAFKSKAYTDVEADIRLLRGDNIVQGCLRWDDVKKWPATDIESYDRYQLQEGDVVLAMDRPWIKAGLKHAMMTADDLPCLLVQRTARLRAGANLETRFLMYLLSSDAFAEHILGVQTGIGVPHISGQQIKDFEFTRPPLAEQQRIVGILDEAFEGIATAKANAEKNLQNAHALFESHLQSVFTQHGDGWVEKTLGEIAQFKNGLNYNRNSSGQTLPVVGVSDFQDNYYVPFSEVEPATIDGLLDEGYALRRDDMLTVRSNGSKHLVGRCMLVPEVDETTSYSGFIIRIRFDATQLYPKFLLHFMKCQTTRDTLTKGGGGANITNINQEKLSALLVSYPPHFTQVKIATELDSLREETQRLATIYARKLAALDDLKKSLLHRAFSGEL